MPMPTPTLNDAEFALLWNNSEAYPTLADIARKAGLARQTIKNMARNYRRRVEQGEKLPRLIDRTVAPSERSTLPELQHQFKDMSKPELIELLQSAHHTIGRLLDWVVDLDPHTTVATAIRFRTASLALDEQAPAPANNLLDKAGEEQE